MECVATLDFYDKLILYAVIPPVVLALMAAVPYTILVCQDRYDMDDSPTWREQRKLRRRKVLKLVVFALFLMYPTISSRILSFFACRDVEGRRYLSADFHLECDTPEWHRNLPLAIGCLLVYPVGIPVAVFVILWRNRLRMKLPTVHLAYQPEYWYFELVDITAKVGVVVFVVVLLWLFLLWFGLGWIGVVGVIRR